MEKLIDNMSIKDILEAINIKNVDEIPYLTLIKLLNKKIENADSSQKKKVFIKIKEKIESKVNNLDLNNLILNDEGNFENTVYNNNVIKDKQTTPKTTFVTNLKGGVLNPLERREQHYLLHINTRYREKRQNTKIGGGGNSRNTKLIGNSHVANKVRQTTLNEINISKIITSKYTTIDDYVQIDVYLHNDIQDLYGLTTINPPDFKKYLNIISNNTNTDIFDEEYLNIDYSQVEVDFINSKHLVFKTNIEWDSLNTKIINKNAIYTNKDVNIKNIPISYENDYGNIDGRPITDDDLSSAGITMPPISADDLETEIKGLSLFPNNFDLYKYSDPYRRSQQLPNIRLYGRRELFKMPENKVEKKYTIYGGYTENSKGISIVLPEQDAFENQTSNTTLNMPIHIESNTDFTINLSRNFEIISMSLESFTLVNALYTFSSTRKNNFFYITSPYDSSELIKITIPSGTYKGSEIATYLNTRFEAISGFYSLKVSWSHITGKIVIYYEKSNDCSGCSLLTDNNCDCSGLGLPEYYQDCELNPDCSGVTNYSPTIYFGNMKNVEPKTSDLNVNLEQNAGWVLGFKRASYTFQNFATCEESIMFLLPEKTTPQITSIGCFIEAESVYNPHQLKVVFLVVDDFNNNKNNTHINAYDGDSIHDNILAQITFHPSDGTNFTRENMTASIDYKSREYFGPVNIKRLNIKLVDEFGNPVDINENDYLLTLKFDSLYNI